MKEEGIVAKIDNNEVTIEISPQSACTKCCSCGSSETRTITITDENAKDLKAGDKVTYEIEASSMMKVYMLLYLFPLVAFVSTLLIVYAIFRSPVISFLAGMIAAVGAYALVGRYLRQTPQISAKILPNN